MANMIEQRAQSFASVMKQKPNFAKPRLVINPNPPAEDSHQQKLPKVNDSSFREVWQNRVITKNHGVAFPIASDVKQADFLDSLASVVKPEDIFSVGRSGRRVIAYFRTTTIANELMMNGISINNVLTLGQPIERRPTRVIVSDLLPHIPTQPVIDYLKQFGELNSQFLRPIPIQTNGKQEFTHIISHRQEIYMHINEGAEIPRKLILKVADDEYEIEISTENTCRRCKSNIHQTHECPYNNSSSANTSSVNDRLQRCVKCNEVGHSVENCQEFPSIQQTIIPIPKKPTFQKPNSFNSSIASVSMTSTGSQMEDNINTVTLTELIPAPEQTTSKVRKRPGSNGSSPAPKIQALSSDSESDTEMTSLDFTDVDLSEIEQTVIKMLANTHHQRKLEKIKSIVDDTNLPYDQIVSTLRNLKTKSHTFTDDAINFNQRVERLAEKISKKF